MAMSSVIRKITCHTINVPLSLRAIANPRRIFTGSVTKSKSLISGEKHRLVHMRESFVISNQYFSTLTDVVADFKKSFNMKVSKLLKYEFKSYKRLKPAIQLPQLPADFPFNIHDTPGEDKIRLTRELAGDNILIEACCYFNDVKKSTQDYSFSPNSLSTWFLLDLISRDSSDLLGLFFFWKFVSTGSSNADKDDHDYHRLQVKFTVTNPKEKGSKVEFTEFRFKFMAKWIEFFESNEHWREFPAIRSYDEDLIKFLTVYMVRRNKLKACNRLLRNSGTS